MNTLPTDVLSTWPGWNEKVQLYRSMGYSLISSRHRAAMYFRTYYDENGNFTGIGVNNVPPPTLYTNVYATANANAATVAHQFDQAILDEVPQEAVLPAQDLTDFLNDLTTKKVRKNAAPSGGKTLLQNIYSYPKMNFQKDITIAYEKSAGPVANPFEFVTTNGIVGIEVEVENITNNPMLPAYWSVHEDGSLRNHGLEFVSIPLQVKQIQSAIELLYSTLKKTNQPQFTNRTSVHVHLNCRDLTQDQVYALVLLYAIFEKHFYGYAGTRRMNSIFCVPLFRCNLLQNARECIYNFAASWHKYCGINLLPLTDNNGRRGYGTVEFRHLYGTDNSQEVLEWIDNILCLRKAALEISLDEVIAEIKSMNTTSSYLSLFSRVFPKQKVRASNKDFEECISNIKRELFGNEYLYTLNKNADSPYWNAVRSLGVKG